MPGTLKKLPAQAERKAGTTSSHHGPYVLGHTRATMVGTESQFGLESATRLYEAGIASNRASAMAR